LSWGENVQNGGGREMVLGEKGGSFDPEGGEIMWGHGLPLSLRWGTLKKDRGRLVERQNYAQGAWKGYKQGGAAQVKKWGADAEKETVTSKNVPPEFRSKRTKAIKAEIELAFGEKYESFDWGHQDILKMLAGQTNDRRKLG